MWLLAIGAGVPRGATDRTVHHVDVAATAAALLGMKAGEMAGAPMRELLL